MYHLKGFMKRYRFVATSKTFYGLMVKYSSKNDLTKCVHQLHININFYKSIIYLRDSNIRKNNRARQISKAKH